VSSVGLATGSNSGWSVFAEKRICVTWMSGVPKVTLTKIEVPAARDESLQLPISHAQSTAPPRTRPCSARRRLGLAVLIER
jgi:hypothetical protein